MNLRFSQRDGKKPYRVAVVVSRKVSKSAVVRNRIRRRVYAQVRLAADIIPAGTDMVFTVYSDKLLELEPAKLKASIEDLLKKTVS